MPTNQFLDELNRNFREILTSGEWEMEFESELAQSSSAALVLTAMRSVDWTKLTQERPYWQFPTGWRGDDLPVETNDRGSSSDFLIILDFAGWELCPRLCGADQYDKMAGLFGLSWDFEKLLASIDRTQQFGGFDIGDAVAMAQSNSRQVETLPEALRMMTHGPEIGFYFMGLLSKSLGYALYECGAKSLMEDPLNFYTTAQELWESYTQHYAEEWA